MLTSPAVPSVPTSPLRATHLAVVDAVVTVATVAAVVVAAAVDSVADVAVATVAAAGAVSVVAVAVTAEVAAVPRGTVVASATSRGRRRGSIKESGYQHPPSDNGRGCSRANLGRVMTMSKWGVLLLNYYHWGLFVRFGLWAVGFGRGRGQYWGC